MPKHILQVNQPMFETQLDRMVSREGQRDSQPDAGRFRPTRSRVPPAMSAPVAGRRIGPAITGVI